MTESLEQLGYSLILGSWRNGLLTTFLQIRRVTTLV